MSEQCGLWWRGAGACSDSCSTALTLLLVCVCVCMGAFAFFLLLYAQVHAQGHGELLQLPDLRVTTRVAASVAQRA